MAGFDTDRCEGDGRDSGRLEYKRFNGTSWVDYGFTGSFAAGPNAPGIARNPVTGRVHKMVDNGASVGVRTYAANAWSAASNVMGAEARFHFWMTKGPKKQQEFSRGACTPRRMR